jgi:chromosomal replication initiator protein
MDITQTKQLEILSVEPGNRDFEEFLFKKDLKQDEMKDCMSLFKYLRNGFGENAYQRILKHIRYAGIREERNAVVLVVQSDFIKTVIIQSYFRDISTFVYNNCSAAKKIEIIVKKLDNPIKLEKPITKQVVQVTAAKQYIEEHKKQNIDSHISFENFVFGDSNKVAYWSARQASDMIVHNTANSIPCLCIFGPVGMGKTHLMKSIASHVKNSNSEAKIEYLSAEEFKESYIDAIRRNDLFSFKKRFADLDALLMDDVQFICSGSGNLEKEFARILNHLIDNRRWIVIACDRPPSSLSIDERTKSRISSGFKASIQQSDFNLRMLILQSKMQRMYNSYDISNDTLQYIAQNVMSSIRELESILHNIISYASLMKVRNIQDNLVQEIIGRCDFKTNDVKSITEVQEIRTTGTNLSFDDFLNKTCSYYGVTRNDILGTSRIQKVSRARAAVAYILRNNTAMTLKDIGEKLSRNHATVMYLINSATEDKSLQDEINNIIKQIK